MKSFARIRLLLFVSACLVVSATAAEKEKVVGQAPEVTGRVAKVDGGSITIEVRAMKRRGKVVSPEKEVSFKANCCRRDSSPLVSTSTWSNGQEALGRQHPSGRPK